MTKAPPARKGRRPNEKPVFSPGDIEAIVIGDERIRDLVPAYSRVVFSTSFDRFRELCDQHPNAGQESIAKHWQRSIKADLNIYAAQMARYWRELHDDLLCAAHFHVLEGNDERLVRVGFRPTTDDARAINAAFANALDGFRMRGCPSVDGLKLVLAKKIIDWLSYQAPITKTLASREWDRRFRHRPARVRAMQNAIAAINRRRRNISPRYAVTKLRSAQTGAGDKEPIMAIHNSGLTSFRHDGQPVPLASEYSLRSFEYSVPVNTAATAASTNDEPARSSIIQSGLPQVSFLRGMRIEKTTKGEWRIIDGQLNARHSRRGSR